jgi:hypothetical protein
MCIVARIRKKQVGLILRLKTPHILGVEILYKATNIDDIGNLNQSIVSIIL